MKMLLYKQKKNQNVKGNRLLISINVLGSAGPIRFIVSEEQLVADVIDTALKSYAREGRLPILGSDLHDFQLYCPSAGPDGNSNFIFCSQFICVNSLQFSSTIVLHVSNLKGWRKIRCYSVFISFCDGVLCFGMFGFSVVRSFESSDKKKILGCSFSCCMGFFVQPWVHGTQLDRTELETSRCARNHRQRKWEKMEKQHHGQPSIAKPQGAGSHGSTSLWIWKSIPIESA